MRRNILKKTHKMQAKKIKKETKIYINLKKKKKFKQSLGWLQSYAIKNCIYTLRGKFFLYQ